MRYFSLGLFALALTILTSPNFVLAGEISTKDPATEFQPICYPYRLELLCDCGPSDLSIRLHKLAGTDIPDSEYYVGTIIKEVCLPGEAEANALCKQLVQICNDGSNMRVKCVGTCSVDAS